MHIKNTAGTEVKTVDLASQGKGQHTYVWDGKIPTPATNSDGTPILDASGNPIMQNAYAPLGQYTVTVDYVSKVAVPAIPPGELQQYQVDTNGNITAKFSNGLNSVIGQIPIFQFSNQQGLSKEGDNLYSESANSGQVMLYKDSKGVYMPGVEVQSNMLETSNVSLSDAMTELIVTQRAFDANSKCVTTSDQMIQKALALKRG
jgi:flagellar hook protein FlgE